MSWVTCRAPKAAGKTGPQRAAVPLSASDAGLEHKVERRAGDGALNCGVLRPRDGGDARVRVENIAAELSGVTLHEDLHCGHDPGGSGALRADVIDAGPGFGDAVDGGDLIPAAPAEGRPGLLRFPGGFHRRAVRVG